MKKGGKAKRKVNFQITQVMVKLLKRYFNGKRIIPKKKKKKGRA